LDGDTVVTEWYRSGFEKDSGKEAYRRQDEGKRTIGGRWGILRLTTRLSYVYLTYMLRISYVIDKELIGFFFRFGGIGRNSY